MKFKQNIVITRPENFLRGEYGNCFHLFDSTEYLCTDWQVVGEVKFEVDVDTAKLIKVVSDKIDEQIGQATAALNVLEQRKAELLALPELK